MTLIQDILEKKTVKGAITAGPKDTLMAAATKLAEHNIGLVVVVDQDKVVGVLSERDFIRKGVVKKLDFEKILVEEIMTTNVIFAKPVEPVANALKVFKEHKFRHLPVKDTENRLQGVLTERDIIKILMERLEKK